MPTLGSLRMGRISTGGRGITLLCRRMRVLDDAGDGDNGFPQAGITARRK
jgi:hypothetical protein